MKSRRARALAGLLDSNPSSTTGFSALLIMRAASAMAALSAGPSPEYVGIGKTSRRHGRRVPP